MAGYSATPLPHKLGIKHGHLVLLDGAPAAWQDGWPASHGTLPEAIDLRHGLRAGPADVIVAFFTSAGRLRRRFAALKGKIKQAGALWIAWPKQAAKLDTDLTDTVVREVGLAGGLVDVKVCAVDATWSGLKFVYRLADRD